MVVDRESCLSPNLAKLVKNGISRFRRAPVDRGARTLADGRASLGAMKRQRSQTDETVAQPQAAAKGRALADQGGSFDTPPLHPTRAPNAPPAAARSMPMTAAEAAAQAEAEGLTLVRASAANQSSWPNQSGFRNVSVHLDNKAKPYKASVARDGKKLHLGCFVTPEEAALHVARTPEAKASLLEAEAKAAAATAKAIKPRTSAAQAKEDAKLAAKAALVQARQEQKELLRYRRQQLEQHRQQMAAQQAQMLRAAAERQRQRAAPAPSAPPTAAAEPATGSTDALVQQVLRRGGCPFRCLGLERGASQEGVRKRYLALALRLHPDKAQHPQADEAFAALEGAYSRARDAAAADAAAS